MIPSTGPPFAMTRWVPQTRQNYVSGELEMPRCVLATNISTVTPYNQTDSMIRGFQGTHQPAIWMGESGQVVVAPAFSNGAPATAFEERGLEFDKAAEISTPSYYSAVLRDGFNNQIKAEQSSSGFPVLLTTGLC
jgi:putative alpha-1,2-mannosidase